MSELSERKIKRLKGPCRVGDGGGLYLTVKAGRMYWSFIGRDTGNPDKVDKAHLERTGKVRYLPSETGLGSYPDVSIEKARAKAAEARALRRDGKDPKAVRDQRREDAAGIPTFATAAEEYIASECPSWRSPRYLAQVQKALRVECKPFAGKRVNEVTTDDIRRVGDAVSARAPTTAQRVVQAVQAVLDRAQLRGHIASDKRNPALGLSAVLTHKPKDVVNHPSMDYREVPAFMNRLRAHRYDVEGRLRLDVLALEFTILTAARTKEVRFAIWDEIDKAARTWKVPAARMKMKRDHLVALSDAAMEILELAERARRNGLLFPGFTPDKPFSDKVFERLLREFGYEARGTVTTHGFRSSFSMWADAETDVDRSIVEFALAHRLTSATEEAYRRKPPVQKLAQLFRSWGDYLGRRPAVRIAA
jgi:integrase